MFYNRPVYSKATSRLKNECHNVSSENFVSLPQILYPNATQTETLLLANFQEEKKETFRFNPPDVNTLNSSPYPGLRSQIIVCGVPPQVATQSFCSQNHYLSFNQGRYLNSPYFQQISHTHTMDVRSINLSAPSAVQFFPQVAFSNQSLFNHE